MAWGHSEDIALDSGGNFSRFFSLSPEVFCVRRRFLLRLFFFSEKVCVCVRKSCFSFLDDGLFFWFHLCDAKFKWFSVKFSHNFHKELRGDTVGPKTKFAHFFSRGALMLLTLLFRDYFTLLSRNYDFCRNYSLGLNFTTFPENTLIQFSFFFRSPEYGPRNGC